MWKKYVGKKKQKFEKNEQLCPTTVISMTCSLEGWHPYISHGTAQSSSSLMRVAKFLAICDLPGLPVFTTPENTAELVIFFIISSTMEPSETFINNMFLVWLDFHQTSMEKIEVEEHWAQPHALSSLHNW